ncbi:patatin-like phospholipase family protein [Conexibacter sp. SYSU D00693]|uniref:patatin-like phospholipase family protein n=1 Tax=Conexibacter sp. SYSU D00693 TaxID=2812560 RepID=UPI00196B8273|nr:patatin-like phospholipase family protein [Conexibacter sp. SYSU D00693]
MPRIAIVLPGGGARGAYEAGALSVLLPELEARGERPTIFCGTSVGAINAALLGSLADRPATEVAEALVARWTDMRKGDVLRPVVGPGIPLMLARLLGEVLEVPGIRLAALLDPTPLQRSLERWIDWLALHRNARSGALEAVCVVATSLAHGGPVAFVHAPRRGSPALPGDDPRYVRVTLQPEHVRASAAIPMLFPPVEVKTPASVAGHYIDGGTRLNSPIAPALALGAERVVVLGFEPFAARAEPARRPGTPRFADVAANILDGLLVDQVADDVHRLASINTFFADGAASGISSSARAYRHARGRAPYRKVAYALVAPERRGELAELADEVFRQRYAGLRGLLAPDYPLISRLLGGDRSGARGELLSFLLFDEVFTGRLLEQGRRDAQRWLDRHPAFWCADAAHDLDVDATAVHAAREQAVLDEYRAMRRR